MFATLAPEMGGMGRVVLSNLWLFGPLVQGRLEQAATTNAMVRTTTALTVVRAGDAENVLPGQATAVVNYRLAPGDSIQSVVEHARKTLDDPRVSVKVRAGAVEASPVSSTASPAYQVISRTVREVMPDVVVAPGLVIGGTDSRHFASLSDQVFRFSPVRTRPEDLGRFHGTNERIAVANLVELVRFYHRLMEQAAG
jgi:carboxypeptidase PM20D1